MAVQPLTGAKRIVRTSGNPPPKPIVKRAPQHTIVEEDMSVYGDSKPLPPQQPNIDINQLANAIAGKITNGKSMRTAPAEVDIKREIAISNVDKNAVESDVYEGKVMTKSQKLRALRRGHRGS